MVFAALVFPAASDPLAQLISRSDAIPYTGVVRFRILYIVQVTGGLTRSDNRTLWRAEQEQSAYGR